MFIDMGYWVINFIHTKTALFILQGIDDSLKTQTAQQLASHYFKQNRVYC